MKTYSLIRALYVSILLIPAMFTGCKPTTGAQPVALLLLKTLNNPYFVELSAGVQEEWKNTFPEIKLEIRAGTEEGDIKAHREILDTYLRSYVLATDKPQLKALLITPASSGPELIPKIKAMRQAGVPVIVIDTKLESKYLLEAKTDYTAFVGSSNRQGGALAAEFVFKQTPEIKSILLLNGLDGHETAHERREGFVNKAKTLMPKVTILERTCDWNRAKARTTVGSMIAGGQTSEALFAANDEMAIGAISAYEQAGDSLRPKVIIGFDATEEARLLVRQKKLTMTVAQNPHAMGKEAVKILSASLHAPLARKDNLIDVELVLP